MHGFQNLATLSLHAWNYLNEAVCDVTQTNSFRQINKRKMPYLAGKPYTSFKGIIWTLLVQRKLCYRVLHKLQ